MNLEVPSRPSIRAQRRTSNGLAVQLRSDSPGVLQVPEMEAAIVSVHVGRAAIMSCRRAGLSHMGTAVHGDIDIIPAGVPSVWQMHDNNDNSVMMAVSSDLMRHVAEENGHAPRAVELRNRFVARDRQLESIAWAMKSELEMGSPSGSLYLEGLALSAASRLLAGHSSLAVEQRRNGGLDGRRLRRALDYIEAHLAEELSLARLAEVTGMSTSHFRAGFRESAGVPVHQYVIERRIEHARTLLRDPELSVAEIALASGFTHQSHLARHLQRATGHSPLQMRRLYADHLPPMAAD